MRRDDALAILRSHREELQRLGVVSLTLFGSVARDEARSDSNLDLLAELRRPAGYFEVVQLADYLEQILGVPIDLLTPGAVSPTLKTRIEREAVRAACPSARPGARHAHGGPEHSTIYERIVVCGFCQRSTDDQCRGAQSVNHWRGCVPYSRPGTGRCAIRSLARHPRYAPPDHPRVCSRGCRSRMGHHHPQPSVVSPGSRGSA